MLEHISQFLLYCQSSGPLQLPLKVNTVAYKKWSLTEGSKYSDLTLKLSVFRKTGH